MHVDVDTILLCNIKYSFYMYTTTKLITNRVIIEWVGNRFKHDFPCSDSVFHCVRTKACCSACLFRMVWLSCQPQRWPFWNPIEASILLVLLRRPPRARASIFFTKWSNFDMFNRLSEPRKSFCFRNSGWLVGFRHEPMAADVEFSSTSEQQQTFKCMWCSCWCRNQLNIRAKANFLIHVMQLLQVFKLIRKGPPRGFSHVFNPPLVV